MNANSISTSSLVCRSQDQVSTRVDDDTVMMNTKKGMYYGLDDIGTDIWELIDKPCSVSSIIDALKDKYDVDEDTCKKELFDLLAALQKRSLIVVSHE
jgi:hypothetical protein